LLKIRKVAFHVTTDTAKDVVEKVQCSPRQTTEERGVALAGLPPEIGIAKLTANKVANELIH
jgi:hypothetical protein